MTPENVKNFILFNNDCPRTQHFLLKFALYWAEQGQKVMYITQTPLNSLPKEMRETELKPFSKIQFWYFPRRKDLLVHLHTVHLKQIPPSVIIIENFEHYCSNPNTGSDTSTNHLHNENTLMSLTAATLMDCAAVCAGYNYQETQLAISLGKKNATVQKLPNVFFIENTWYLSDTDTYPNTDCHMLIKRKYTEKDMVFHFRMSELDSMFFEKIANC